VIDLWIEDGDLGLAIGWGEVSEAEKRSEPQVSDRTPHDATTIMTGG
jgi:hypothetical protein